MRYCVDGWPDKDKLNVYLKPFYDRRNEISVDKGCLLWGIRVIFLKTYKV